MTETFILCRSQAQKEKDKAIVERAAVKIAERLTSIKDKCEKQNRDKAKICSDLSIRPVWHQKEERVLAHIFVCFLAYVLRTTLGQLCRKAGLGDEPRRVISELSEIRLVDVVLPTKSGPEIRNRCVARPTDHQRILLEKLGLKLPTRIRESKM